ncbi:MAG: fluoride efflux transporter FluC [Planctomycetia bacterium]
MNTVTHLVMLGLAGAVGTLLRAGCNGIAIRWYGTGFPWGTLAVNVAGSFAFGMIFGILRGRGGLDAPGVEAILLVGLLGGFTTFSSFAFQSVELAESGRMLAALAYVAATNVAAIAAIWAGLRVSGA